MRNRKKRSAEEKYFLSLLIEFETECVGLFHFFKFFRRKCFSTRCGGGQLKKRKQKKKLDVRILTREEGKEERECMCAYRNGHDLRGRQNIGEIHFCQVLQKEREKISTNQTQKQKERGREEEEEVVRDTISVPMRFTTRM